MFPTCRAPFYDERMSRYCPIGLEITFQPRALFENLLACRNRHGLLSEHIDPATRELWGNFPQTYSMVGLINSATRLSISWDEAF